MKRLTARGLKWGVVTNGWNLKGEAANQIAKHATFVRVSLDAGTSPTHQRIHVAPMPQFETILTQMANVRHLSERVTIGASFCVFDSNVDEIQIAASRLKAIGANYLEVRPIYPTTWRGGRQDDRGLSEQNVDAAKAILERARQAVQDDGFRIVGLIDRFNAVNGFHHADHYDKCRITNLSTVISADGEVYACCVHRGLEGFKGGSVLERPFADVWTGQQRREMEANIDIAKCPKCRYVGLNGVLAHAFMGDGLHRDFI
jgi:radical SAM protein with 4Fe4S-binding SPASM domain